MIKKRVLSWEEINSLTDKLAEVIKRHTYIKYITGIPRGGLIPAVLLSHKLDIPLIPIDSIYTRLVFSRNGIGDDITSKNILIVDDISDSGNTLNNFNDFLSATLFMRHTSKKQPFTYGELIEDDSWLVFPWEKVDSKPIQGYLEEK